MRISGSRLYLRVAQRFADHYEVLAQGQRPRSYTSGDSVLIRALRGSSEPYVVRHCVSILIGAVICWEGQTLGRQIQHSTTLFRRA